MLEKEQKLYLALRMQWVAICMNSKEHFLIAAQGHYRIIIVGLKHSVLIQPNSYLVPLDSTCQSVML